MGEGAADNLTIKIDPIHPDWHAMFSGNDITKVDLMLDFVREKLPQGSSLSVSQVADVFALAYRKMKQQIAENTLLFPMGTMNKFLKDGPQRLGAENFTALLQRVQSVVIDCQFLVSGFDKSGEPHILSVGNDGDPKIYDRVGFWAIGSGQQNALSTLFFHGYNRLKGYHKAVYHVCEAKFMAETAEGVGPRTFRSLFNFKRRRLYVEEPNIKKIREAWQAGGQPRVPEGILDKIPPMIEGRRMGKEVGGKGRLGFFLAQRAEAATLAIWG